MELYKFNLETRKENLKMALQHGLIDWKYFVKEYKEAEAKLIALYHLESVSALAEGLDPITKRAS